MAKKKILFVDLARWEDGYHGDTYTHLCQIVTGNGQALEWLEIDESEAMDFQRELNRSAKWLNILMIEWNEKRQSDILADIRADVAAYKKSMEVYRLKKEKAAAERKAKKAANDKKKKIEQFKKLAKELKEQGVEVV